jgi:hypothetical protein
MVFKNFDLTKISEFSDIITRFNYDKEWLWEQTLAAATLPHLDQANKIQKNEEITNLLKRYQNATLIGNLAYIFLFTNDFEKREAAFGILEDIDQYLTENPEADIEITEKISDFPQFKIDIEVYDINNSEKPDYFDRIFSVAAQKDQSPARYITNNDVYEFGKSLFPDEQVNDNFGGYITQFRKLHLNKFIHNVRLAYKDAHTNPCQIFHIIALINRVPYGSIMLYRDYGSDTARIQWIFRFPVATMFGLLNPLLQKKLPRLNTILVPAVITLGLGLGIKTIYVAPVGAQVNILRNTYLFVPSESMIKPCNLNITPGFEAGPRIYLKKRIQ